MSRTRLLSRTPAEDRSEVRERPPARRRGRPSHPRRLAPLWLAPLAALAVGLALAGYSAWPYLGFALAPAGLWTAGVAGLLWRRPRQSPLLARLAMAALLLTLGIAGLLELYVPGWGGYVGEELIGASLLVGGSRLALLGVAAVAVATPRQSWQVAAASARLGTHGFMGALALARTIATTLAPLALAALVLVGRTVWAAALLGGRGVRGAAMLSWRLAGGAVRAYLRHPVHLYLLRAAWWGLTLPVRVARPRRRRATLRAGEPIALLPPRALAGIRPRQGPGHPEKAGARRPDPSSWEIVPPPNPAQALPGRDDLRAEEAQEEAGPANQAQIVDLREGPGRRESLSSGSGGWRLPPLDILNRGERLWVSQEENQATARRIEQVLGEFGIDVAVSEIRPGPVVTQYGLAPGWMRRYREVKERNADGTPVRDERGKSVTARVEEKTRVKVDHILAREKDLALALAAPSVRFEAPVPGESFVGLEVPNAAAALVSLRSLLESRAFHALQRKGRLPIALGQGSGGEPVVTDLADMPHLLIAGATGSGKSVCMNTIICSLAMQFSPMELQMYMVDPKRVEMTPYNGLPHLAGPVLVEVEQAAPMLNAIIAEMNSRYRRFEAVAARNIQAYNAKAAGPQQRIPYLVLVIDELAHLMMSAPAEVEQALCRLAQLGRATGIHLVVATQRPSVDVITGLIKANFPSRISFKVSSQVDSRTILDGAGAEKLLGRGDMLFTPSDAAKPKRLQGAFIADDEVRALVSHWKSQRGNQTHQVRLEPGAPPPEAPRDSAVAVDSDLEQARELAAHHTRISASLLQRRLGIGFAKASSILDHLEEMRVVGPGAPGMSRQVLAGGGPKPEKGA